MATGKDIIFYTPSGGLNLDDDYKSMPKGDYTGALNVRPVSNDSGNTIAYEVILGNGLAVTVPIVPTQNKIYKFTFPTTGTWSTTINTYDAAGAFVSSITITQATATPIAVFETYLNGLGGGYTFSYAIVGQVLTAQVLGEKEISFIFEQTGAGITFVITQEAYDPNIDGQTGPLFPFGSKQLGDILYVFSTCCNNDTGGTGEIGVITYNGNTNAYAYITLLRSKEFNFTLQHQIDCDAYPSFKDQVYFNDDFNPDRVFYYQGAYVANGALNYIDSDNIYLYGSIGNQIRDVAITTNTTLAFTNQYQSGGALLSGGYYYTARLLTPSLESTDARPLSQMIPVDVANNLGPGKNIIGSAPGSQTSKINEITVSNIDTAVFKYIELDVIYNANGSVLSYTVFRKVITDSTIVLQHTGNEAVTTRDISQFFPLGVGILHSKNIRLINNRRVKSNITVQSQGDMSDIVAGITFTDIQKTIPGVGNANDLVLNTNGAEYQLPANVYANRSFMSNDWYAFGLLPEFTAGNFGQIIYGGKHQITPLQTDLTSNGAGNGNPPDVYLRGVQVGGLDIANWASQLKALHLVIAKPIKQVVCAGIFILPIDASNNVYYGDIPIDKDGVMFDYPQGKTAAPKAGFFMSFDAANGNPIVFESGDYLNIYSQPYRQRVDLANSAVGTPNSYISAAAEFNGFVNNHAAVQYTITGIQPINSLSSIGFNYNGAASTFYTSHNFKSGASFVATQNVNESGYVISLNSSVAYAGLGGLNESGSAINYAIYYAQYVRPVSNPYNDPAQLQWAYTGNSLLIDTNTPLTGNDIGTYSGDVFIQKSYTKIASPYSPDPAAIGAVNIGGFALGYYAENRLNSQERYYISALPGYIFPAGGLTPDVAGVTTWLNNDNFDQYNYDTGNTPRADLVNYTTFNANLPQVTKYPTRFYYSSENPLGSITDFFLQIAPLNFYDEQGQDGAVIHTEVANGQLYSFQKDAFRRQLMNDQILTKTNADNEVLINSVGVFASPSVKITSYGSKHKWGIVKSKSPSGDDNLHWLNTEYQKWVRFAGDGTVPISDLYTVKTFLANQLRFADLYDTPCSSYGIAGFADNRFSEVGFTVRAQYLPLNNGSLVLWLSNGIYHKGDVVSNGLATTGYEKFTNIWECLQNNGTGSNDAQPLSNIYYWKPLTDFSDSRYWNVYTLAFNAKKERFTTFYAFRPYIYLQYRNTFFSPISNKTTGSVWIHNSGTVYQTFYGSQYEQGYLEALVNDYPQAQKIFRNIVQYTLNKIKVLFDTEETSSYLDASDLKKDGDVFGRYIMNDTRTSTDGNTRTQQTRRVSGTWMKVKFLFDTTYNKVSGFAIRWRLRNRKQIK